MLVFRFTDIVELNFCFKFNCSTSNISRNIWRVNEHFLIKENILTWYKFNVPSQSSFLTIKKTITLLQSEEQNIENKSLSQNRHPSLFSSPPSPSHFARKTNTFFIINLYIPPNEDSLTAHIYFVRLMFYFAFKKNVCYILYFLGHWSNSLAFVSFIYYLNHINKQGGCKSRYTVLVSW